MMQGVDAGSGELAGAIASRCYELGLVIETSGPQDEVLKVLAPLTTPDDVLLEGLLIIERAAKAASSSGIAPPHARED
jgi:diaminobutyrate-2-oxoglutarate transaminase